MKPFDKIFKSMLSPVETTKLLMPDKLANQKDGAVSEMVICMVARSGEECSMELEYVAKNGSARPYWQLTVCGELLRYYHDNSRFVPVRKDDDLEKYKYYGGYYADPTNKYLSHDVTYLGALTMVSRAYTNIIQALSKATLVTLNVPSGIVESMMDDLAAHKTRKDGFTAPIAALVFKNYNNAPRLSFSLSRTAGDNFYRVRVIDTVQDGAPRIRYITTQTLAKAELVKTVSGVYDEYYRDAVHDID